MTSIADEFARDVGRIEVDLGTLHHFSSGVYAKQMHLPAGHYAVSHAHSYDHLSILARGVAEVQTDTGTERHTAPACLTIKAGVHHKITAIEDVTWFCIHATEETEPDAVDQVAIAKG